MVVVQLCGAKGLVPLRSDLNRSEFSTPTSFPPEVYYFSSHSLPDSVSRPRHSQRFLRHSRNVPRYWTLLLGAHSAVASVDGCVLLPHLFIIIVHVALL